MKLESIDATGIRGRAFDVCTGGVTVIAGPNESGKTTLLNLVRLAVDPPKRGLHPVVGKAAGWTVTLVYDDVHILRARTGQGHALIVNGEGSHTPAADMQPRVDALLGRAVSWSVSAFLDLSDAARLAWLDEHALGPSAVDVAQVLLRIPAYELALVWGLAAAAGLPDWRVEPTCTCTAYEESGQHAPNCGEVQPVDPTYHLPSTMTGYVFLRTARELLAEADKVNEREIKTLRGAVEQLDREVQDRALPAGTVASWRARETELRATREENARRRGEIAGQAPQRAKLALLIDALERRADAAPITLAPETLQKRRSKLAGQLEEEKARMTIGLVLHEARKILETRRLTVPVSVAADALDQDELVEVRPDMKAELRLKELLRIADERIVEIGARALQQLDKEIDAAIASQELEAVSNELAELGSGDTVTLDEELDAIQQGLAEATRNADTLNDHAALVAAVEQRRALLEHRLGQRRAIRDALDRFTELWARALDADGLSKAASELTLGAMAQTVRLGLTGDGLRIDLADAAGRTVPLASASASQQLIAAAALSVAVQRRLGGWCHLLLDDCEHLDEVRLKAFLTALVGWTQAGMLDNALVAVARQDRYGLVLPEAVTLHWMGP